MAATGPRGRRVRQEHARRRGRARLRVPVFSFDPIQAAMFMKNLAMLGGALVISYFGADPLSLDALLSQRKEVIL